MQANWIPYGRQSIDDDDIEAVTRALRSDWLTTGPEVEAFERELAAACGASHAVVLNSGTAALHAAYFAAGVGPEDEVITSPLTFAATANAALYLGANVAFGDIQPDTGNLNPADVERLISSRTKVVAPVDFTGHPADLDDLIEIAHSCGALVVEDACHALGASYKGRSVGSIADMTVMSFHPVKHITTGEGGAVLTNDPSLAGKVRLFRNHGIVRDSKAQRENGAWHYEMTHLGFNYRMSDIHAALGRSQLRKLSRFLESRRRIAQRYMDLLGGVKGLCLPTVRSDVDPAWHLFVVRLENEASRRLAFDAMHAAGIGVQVHYIPVHHHPYYREHPRRWTGECPAAEEFSRTCFSLPIFPTLNMDDVDRVAHELKCVVEEIERVG